MTSSLVHSGRAFPSRIALISKRTLDILVAAPGLLILLPLFAILAIAIKLDSAGPVIYQQIRVGRDGKPFRILKFRSMVSAADRLGPSLTVMGDPRVTWVGAFLRNYKLDELPQLANVLRGEMSLVGPRPEVPELLQRYTPNERELFVSIKPGMTDYASLLLRNESTLLAGCSDPEKAYQQTIMPIKYALWARYRADMGITTDLRIICATIWTMISHNAPTHLVDPRLMQTVASRSEIMIDPLPR